MYEWRNVLSEIDKQLCLIKTGDADVIARAIHKLQVPANFKDPTAWENLFFYLVGLIGIDFQKLANENQSTKEYILALRDGLNKGVISRQRWMATSNENKDNAIKYILQQIGGEIMKLRPNYYNGISEDGLVIMDRITRLLLHGQTEEDLHE
jgi:hypothetical protein